MILDLRLWSHDGVLGLLVLDLYLWMPNNPENIYVKWIKSRRAVAIVGLTGILFITWCNVLWRLSRHINRRNEASSHLPIDVTPI